MFALVARLAAFSAPLDDPILTLGGESYRVQSLAPSLLRVERKGAKGFEDRNTFLSQIGHPTRPFKSVDQPNATYARLTTAESLVLTLQIAAPTPSCAAPMAGHDATAPRMIADKPARALASQSACCDACDAEKTCVAWVWATAAPDSDGNNCWLLAGSGAPTTSGDRNFGWSAHHGAQLTLTLADADGRTLYEGALDDVAQEPKLPTPAELAAAGGKNRTCFALRDSPRFVPATADMGPTPVPAGSPHEHTSGFDVGNDAADAYFFIAESDGHAPLRRAVLDLTGDVPRLPDFAFLGGSLGIIRTTRREDDGGAAASTTRSRSTSRRSTWTGARLPEDKTGYESTPRSSRTCTASSTLCTASRRSRSSTTIRCSVGRTSRRRRSPSDTTASPRSSTSASISGGLTATGRTRWGR